MMSMRLVKRISEIIGNGSAKLKTTWLMTRAFVALAPSATTTKAGTMVTSRRITTGM
jgi:hypothetical protein